MYTSGVRENKSNRLIFIGGGLMDWRAFADRFGAMTCVLSVEKKPDGTCGTVRIVTGNQKFLDSLELAGGSVDVGNEKKVEFVPDSEYTRYIPKDLNFEDVCFRAPYRSSRSTTAYTCRGIPLISWLT